MGGRNGGDQRKYANSSGVYTNGGGERILMMTAKTVAKNADAGVSKKCNILFDSGSQRTYVSENLAKTLKLKPIGSENLKINAFGGANGVSKVRDVVEVNIVSREGSGEHNVRAVVMRNLCAPITSQSLNRGEIEKFGHLKNLDLADTYDDDKK